MKKRYDPTQYERQNRKNTSRHAPDCCPECGDSHHLVIVNGGLECWSCDAFIPRDTRRNTRDSEWSEHHE